jgi:hypothetical protein
MIRFKATLLSLASLIGLSLILVWPATVLAGGGPENLLLVVNADCPTSKLVANHYIQLRKIPPGNVLYLTNVPGEQRIKLKDFETKILSPIFEYIKSAKLQKQIDYIVYSTGFPTSIQIPDHHNRVIAQIKESQGEQTANQFVKILQPQASLTSLTYFAVHVFANDPSYLGLEANQYFRRPAEHLLERPFPPPLQDRYAAGRRALDDKKLDEAIKIFDELQREQPSQLAVSYSLAQAHALSGDTKAAANWLARSIRLGWCYRDKTKTDPAFASAIADPLFKGIVDRLPDVPYEFSPTLGFSSNFSWAPNGGINTGPGTGMNYVLSTILGIHHEFGMTEREILQHLQRSVAADLTYPQGNFIFAQTSDVRSRTRQPFFQTAISQLQNLGAKADTTKEHFPKSGQISGLQIGSSTFDPKSSIAKILPGSIADNLTSYGGDYTREGQTKLTELIKAGAAGSSGTVVEPYSIIQKFPHPMIQVHYRRGCSLAEAFYQSVSGPFQLLIVGDALCQPWAKPPKFQIAGVEPLQTVSGTLELQFSFTDPSQIEVIDIFVNGKLVGRQPRIENFRFDTAQLPDGYHELRFVAVASNSIQSRSSLNLPIQVNNSQKNLALSATAEAYHVQEQIELTIDTNVEGPVEIYCNSLKCAELLSGSGKVAFPAALIGRGPVSLRAVSKVTDDTFHQSLPLQLTINGLVSNDLPEGSR